MASLNISLPATLKSYVEDRVREEGYSTPSEYMRTLVREDRKRRAMEKVEALLMDGLKSGNPTEPTAEYWQEKRRRLSEREADR